MSGREPGRELSYDARMVAFKIYHNPRCSKSRAVMQIIEEAGRKARVVEYLTAPPSREELADIVGKLGIQARELVRRGEAVFKERYAGKSLSADEWIDAMVAHPILIERPIVVVGERAVIGRPPDRVRELLDDSGD